MKVKDTFRITATEMKWEQQQNTPGYTTKELKTEIWNTKATEFNMLTEYKDTLFLNYYKITHHMD